MLKNLLILILKGYKSFVSPLFTPSCRFYPTCSEYGIQALKIYSWPKALLLTGWRIIRCNPFNKGGFDPVKSRNGNLDG